MPDLTGTTVQYILDKTRDSTMAACPWLSYLKDSKKVQVVEGGIRFDTAPLLNTHCVATAEVGDGWNPTTMVFADVVEDATWAWRGARFPVAITHLKMKQNQGMPARLRILEQTLLQVMNNATRSLEDYLMQGAASVVPNAAVWNGMASLHGAAAVGGFFEDQAFAAQTNTVGGINRGVFARWQHQAVTSGGGAMTGAQFDQLLAACRSQSSNGAKPDLILMSPNTWSVLRGVARGMETILAKDALEIGRTRITYEGSVIEVHPSLPTPVGPGATVVNVMAINTEEVFHAFLKGCYFDWIEDDLSLQSGTAVWSKTISVVGTPGAIAFPGSGVIYNAL